MARGHREQELTIFKGVPPPFLSPLPFFYLAIFHFSNPPIDIFISQLLETFLLRFEEMGMEKSGEETCYRFDLLERGAFPSLFDKNYENSNRIKWPSKHD